MRRVAAALLLSTVLSGPAWALQEPAPVKQDARVQTVPYEENQPVSVHLVAGNVAEVEISPLEHIIDVYLSDGAHLKRLLNGNSVFLKAVLALPSQPAFIKSQRADGSYRIYRLVIDARDDSPIGATPEGKSLVGLSPPPGPPPEVRPFTVRFTYPAEANEAKATAHADAVKKWLAQRDLKAAAAKLAAPPPVVVNVGYQGQAEARAQADLSPDSTWDDGQSTYLRFAGNRRMPVPYVLNPDGKEAVVDYTVKDRTIIIHQTAARFRLRDGDLILCITNPNYTAAGYNPGTGTTSPDVVREIRGAAK